MDKYEALITNKVILVLPAGLNKEAIPLNFAFNINKPFVTYGLPKKIKSYIEKRATTLPKIKTKYPKIKALVQSPSVGVIIDVTTTNEKVKDWFKEGIYVMSLEEAIEYKKYFHSKFFTLDENIVSILKGLKEEVNV